MAILTIRSHRDTNSSPDHLTEGKRQKKQRYLETVLPKSEITVTFMQLPSLHLVHDLLKTHILQENRPFFWPAFRKAIFSGPLQNNYSVG